VAGDLYIQACTNYQTMSHAYAAGRSTAGNKPPLLSAEIQNAQDDSGNDAILSGKEMPRDIGSQRVPAMAAATAETHIA
jgi:hypothetical protein